MTICTSTVSLSFEVLRTQTGMYLNDSIILCDPGIQNYLAGSHVHHMWPDGLSHASKYQLVGYFSNHTFAFIWDTLMYESRQHS